MIGSALIGEDGVRDVTTAVDIGSKSWPFDIRLRPWIFRPHIGLLPLSYIAAGDVRPVATNELETGRFRGVVDFNRQYVRSGHRAKLSGFARRAGVSSYYS